MKRPYFTQCIAIDNGKSIWIKASVGLREPIAKTQNQVGLSEAPARPYQKLGLMKKRRFKLKLQGRNNQHDKVYDKDIETDQFGNFVIKIPSNHQQNHITRLQFFETSLYKGLQLIIESIIPYQIQHPLQLIISDFDKTLVDTRYSTPTEMYHSLSKPINYFPTVEKSLKKLKNYMENNYQPFILSASPHFYEKPIRDWLYQKEIFTSNIFLKDYKDLLSWRSGELSAKDLKRQGFYKLDSLVDILEFSGLPEKLVLMGDGFESDSVIYLALRSIIVEKRDPWQVWNHVKKHESFKLNIRQSFTFLQRLNKLSSMAKKHENQQIEMKIYIRCRENDYEQISNKTLTPRFFEEQRQFINFYIA